MGLDTKTVGRNVTLTYELLKLAIPGAGSCFFFSSNQCVAQ
jgi:hypothetical protein